VSSCTWRSLIASSVASAGNAISLPRSSSCRWRSRRRNSAACAPSSSCTLSAWRRSCCAKASAIPLPHEQLLDSPAGRLGRGCCCGRRGRADGAGLRCPGRHHRLHRIAVLVDHAGHVLLGTERGLLLLLREPVLDLLADLLLDRLVDVTKDATGLD